MLTRFWQNTSGATSIEYAIIAGFLSILIVGAVRTVGTRLSTLYLSPISNNLT